MTPRESDDYILGADAAEIDRLRFQHKVWIAQAFALWERAGFRAGDTVVDLGCGPGFTSLDLAQIVGPDGRIIAVDQSEHFLATLAHECGRRGIAHVEPLLAPIEALALDADSVGGAYARWLFSWPAAPEVGFARVARALAPGGVFALQEYLDWSVMRLMPRSAIFERAVEACVQSWIAGGGTIDIGRELPRLAQATGLTLEHFAPLSRIGAVGSLEWRWIASFFHSYLPKLVTLGLFGEDELAAFEAEWAARTAGRATYCYAPTMVDALLKKP